MNSHILTAIFTCASVLCAGNAVYNSLPTEDKDLTASKAMITETGLAPDGLHAVDCDLPVDLHLKNVGGRDGAGLCVFTSISHAARWQRVDSLKNFRDYMTQFNGGGWPEKVDEFIARLSREKGTPVPDYVQVTGTPDTEILKLACRTGRMPSVTYSCSPTGRYGGQKIAHMVSLFAAGDGPYGFCVMDNNFPKSYEWMDEATFKRIYGPGNWAVILLDAPPPPVPHN